ncbi:MAG: hypothetical protein K9N49_07600 [Candidatus Marinimicrobia bacterium]|nr:hypothetical protein [Candidatus Neomarinimicrobiota bacterium]
MNSRERLTAALARRCPDRVPYDLAGTHVSGIHQTAYRKLCRHLGVADDPAPWADAIQQVVQPAPALLDRLGVDTRGLYPLCSHNDQVPDATGGGPLEFIDEWGFTQRFPADGYWWSLVQSPLDQPEADLEQIRQYPWPRADRPDRLTGLRQQAEAYRAAGKIVMLKGLCAGPFEMGQRLRGMENFLCDISAEPELAATVLDRFTELKMQFWEWALAELGDVVDIVVETDDYGTQESQLISPATFRAMLKPRLKELFAVIKNAWRSRRPPGEPGWLFFHSCGNVRPIIPDFIEIGVDILNPIHVSASGMAPVALKQDFGSEIAFWGGGVETQHVLAHGSPAEVGGDVKRNLEALMPGGGYVFNTVHNIQADAPPENIMAMWETLQEYGRY